MVAPSPWSCVESLWGACVAWGHTEKGGQAASGPGTWEIDSDSWHLLKIVSLGKGVLLFGSVSSPEPWL